ncbi:unnamed protein product [Bemisia tabaci]|uniref:C2CD3 N-terminal C2 domain-containing protein n=1 Tax=Bemisia tabaci TaxID=7038 RepID=A0A9P0FZS1_BEMTA|nr:unnamed protein product [Bemisia tabaci]
MSGDVTKVLPPRFNGQTTGCLQMNVKTIRWLFDSPGQVVVATSWWGDDSKCLFMPKEDNQPIRNTVQNRSYIFNICSSREKFLTYLQYHKRLKFLVLKEKNVLGVGTLENLSQIFHNRHYDNFVDVYDKDSQLIADVHVCFNLTIFPENSPRSFIQRIDSHENDLNPRRTVPFYSQAEKLRVGFGERADEEPRCPVFSHLDDTRKLLEYLQADEEKKKMSLERRCPVYSHLDDERKLLDYLKSEERKKNVSLLDITNLCLTDESDETNFALSSPSSKLSSTSVKSCDSRSTTECLQDYLNGVSTKINFYRISLDRIIFNSDGLRKLNGFHSVKHQQQNCPHGTYIIQYQLSKVDPKFRLEKTWPVRHISRRTLANGVIYGENDVYKVRDLRSEDVVTSFKISCQFLNQRLPMFLGDTESLVIKEDTKCSLFIKAVNGITIGKLDIQINVGSSIESLPPPETFSEVCREEIDELIPSSNFESFRAKSNASKYLILKAQLRNASDEKLKNVPSAQYNSYVDNFNSPCITPLETCNVASLQHPPSQPTSYMLSDLHSSSGDFTDEHSTTPQLDALNSKTNARSHVGAQQYFNQNSSRTNDSADFHNAAPKKYAIVTHEFNVIIRNFDHHQDYVVSYVFPESTSHENGKVFSSWSEVSISTNLSRPFFISLPYGVSLKNFLKKTGKKSIIFYFKQPSQNKTSAKAVLDLAELYLIEKLYRSSACSSFCAKTLKVPLFKGNNENPCGVVEICIEYRNWIRKFDNFKSESLPSDQIVHKSLSARSRNNLKPNLRQKNATSSRISVDDGAQHLEQEQSNKDSTNSRLLNVTFCVNENKNVLQESHQHTFSDESKVGSLDSIQITEDSGDSPLTIHYERGNPSTVSKSDRFSHPIFTLPDCKTKTQEVSGLNEKAETDAVQYLSQLKINDASPCSGERQQTKKSDEANLSALSIFKTSRLISPNAVSSYFQTSASSGMFAAPYSHLVLGGESINNAYKNGYENIVADQTQPLLAGSLPTTSPNQINGSKRMAEESFIGPNSTPTFSDEQIFNFDTDRTNVAKSHLHESSRKNVTLASFDPRIKVEETLFDKYDSFPKCSVFKMDLVLPDCENDAVPKTCLSPEIRTVSSDVSSKHEENSSSTCLAENARNFSEFTTVSFERRRNSDSGFFGTSVIDAEEFCPRKSIKNQFSSEPNICKPLKSRPPLDDFGISLRNTSQDKCFLARIGIVRSFNIPMIKLKGTKNLTQPTTYVTFHDCFKRLHTSCTVVETLIPEYNSRHKAWLSAELLKDPEERLVLQVWCKRYQNEFAGPDRVRDRCLGFVFCNLTVLMRNFRYAGGWHQIISPSGKNNGQIQILVKPLQSIDFVKDLECEVLVHSESNLINDLQPYNFYLNAAVTKQKNDVSSKELLSQEILELENQIKELQLSHKKRSMKAESSKIIAGKNAEKNSPISSGKGTAKKIARFLSFRRKSRKHKSLPISEDVSGSVSSGSVIESENIRIAKNNSDKYDSAPVSSNESESPCSESACDGKEEVKKSSSIFVRSFSFKLRKSGRKSKVHQNALLQNLPLYQKNSPQNLDEFDKCMNINSI